jgi:hypothetical protein
MQIEAAIFIASTAMAFASKSENSVKAWAAVRAAASNGGHPVVRFNHVTIAGDDERMLSVGDNQQSFEPPEDPIRPPILGQLDSRPEQIPPELVQFFFKLRKEGESVGCGPRKTGENFIVVNPSNLPGSMLHDGMFERHLTVPSHDHLSLVPNGQHCRRMYPGHSIPFFLLFFCQT